MQKLTFIFFSLLIVVLVSGSLIGCSSGSSETSGNAGGGSGPQACSYGGSSEPGIFGGKKVSQESFLGRSIVSVLSTSYYGQGLQVCTGTLIGQNIVLTAAHCVDPYRTRSTWVVFSVDPICDFVTMGNSRQVQRAASTRLVHKGYSVLNKGSKDDLALVRFDGPIPAGYAPMRLAGSALPLDADTQVLLAGYGTKSDYNSSSEQRHDLQFTYVKPYFGPALEKSGLQMDTSAKFYLDQRQGTGACAGDSGGPSIVKTENGFRVIGVASAVDPLGDRDFKTQDDVTCRKGIIYTSVFYYKNWIEENFKILKNQGEGTISPFAP